MALNVLVVDDSDVIRTMILRTLRLADIPVGTAYEAGNGQEALDIIDSNWVDLVLADINMPVMDGLEMLKRIRADERHCELPVIVVTAAGTTEWITEIEEAGVSAYVHKPFTPETIRNVVDSVTSDLSAGETALEELQSAFTGVLERFVMMDGAPAGAELDSPLPENSDILQASMTFSGGVSGAVTIAAPLDTCREMAANAMGIDSGNELAHAKAQDALAEVLNMTCGYLVLALEPDLQTDITPPKVQGIDTLEWHYLAGASPTVAFDVEGMPVLVSCMIRPRR